jgi:hypothetical protein
MTGAEMTTNAVSAGAWHMRIILIAVRPRSGTRWIQ